ncbi:prolyl 4-hydroxylase subunit alpha-2-like [Anopheles aquasalis]|uniref:prolyl 4-hydroxylase subunit alpha-2-like n=1 Tax=Anopheles aquasalis TaxID=42839 RepID=UPI00215ABEB3|nr:prolyl 4-hydroxylase subunit alpha-2-like [Anopheles aquasalis]
MRHYYVIATFWFYSALLLGVNVTGEYYTSNERMRQLIKLEESLTNHLSRYIENNGNHSVVLQFQRDELQQQLKEATAHDVLYVSHPVTAFLLINRLLTDWQKIGTHIGLDVRQYTFENIEMPTIDDVSGVVEALARLQDLYRLKPNKCSLDIGIDLPFDQALGAFDCYQIADHLLAAGFHSQSIPWFQEALNLWSVDYVRLTKIDVANELAKALYNERRYTEALKLTEEVLQEQPDNAGALFSRKSLENVTIFERSSDNEEGTDTPEYSDYDRLCRGDIQQPDSVQKTLYCFYEHNRTPFLTIAPLKLEQINHDPFIVVYHEIISNSEITNVLEAAHPRLNRALVFAANQYTVTKFRTSTNAWLNVDMFYTHLRPIVQRVEDMTGLTKRSYDQLQIGNYGVGGHYSTHHDYDVPADGQEAFPSLGKGNRVATVMYYLSEVDVGGATVFPNIDVAVFPRKGSAVFWYNLHRNGTADPRTLHAACPVMLGSKWVANQWIHERGLEFKYPCALDPML